MVKKKKARKGFKRSKKEWEESIAGHIGKAIDRIEPLEGLLLIGLALAGVEAFGDWKGALLGPIGLKLAMTQGGTPPIAQIAGVTALGILGAAYIPPDLRAGLPPDIGVIVSASGLMGLLKKKSEGI